ncbi:DUF3581 domain-containing protein [Colwellia sp. D2M02]|uniref:DUF3581 domain-containing protein n=1 Tax=Colwellia asteriadis TaxID=517723 RepID=A0ABN1L597_9GAMM|nr:DUF3581 family protein [Colwellia sp. D2M02]MBU2894148.1 DUF3581 domain-containing protein [Colwellia sp. D2M02]
MSTQKMFIENYCPVSADKISFTRQQGSDFAKQVADDFNPLHNIDAKRFCVPGDLLFSVIIAKSGLYEKMTFDFSGMVNDNVALTFPTHIDNSYDIKDDADKVYLSVQASGKSTTNTSLINALTKAYVSFSGHTFPDILVKLMAENNVMINPARPMVMYQSMSIDLFTLNTDDISLVLAQTSLTIDGKRGDALLAFNLLSNGEVIGRGEKHMLLSGLRDYDQEGINAMIAQHSQHKADYQKSM